MCVIEAVHAAITGQIIIESLPTFSGGDLCIISEVIKSTCLYLSFFTDDLFIHYTTTTRNLQKNLYTPISLSLFINGPSS